MAVEADTGPLVLLEVDHPPADGNLERISVIRHQAEPRICRRRGGGTRVSHREKKPHNGCPGQDDTPRLCAATANLMPVTRWADNGSANRSAPPGRLITLLTVTQFSRAAARRPPAGRTPN